MLDLKLLETFSGNRLRGKRNFLSRFRRHHAPCVRLMQPGNPQERDQLDALLHVWMAQRHLSHAACARELAAIHRCFADDINPRLFRLGSFIEGNLIGLVVVEQLPNGYAMLHFEKADDRCTGVHAHLMHEAAIFLRARGCEHLNYQQDLGLLGLRQAKRSYAPCQMLEKYTVRRMNAALPAGPALPVMSCRFEGPLAVA